MSRVSIVTPCHNDGVYLREAVESALAQTHQDKELIIVDDHSTDTKTLLTLEDLRTQGITVLSTPNGKYGPAAARNIGIIHATGDYILPLDADDIIDPSYLAKAVSVLDMHPEVAVCYCRADMFGLKSGSWNLPPFSFEELLLDNMIFATALFRKQEWVSVGGYDESLALGLEDHAFWLALLSNGAQAHRINEVLFHYRVKGASRTARMEIDQTRDQAALAVFRSHRRLYEKHTEALFIDCRRLREDRAQRECLLSWKLLAPVLRLEWRLRQRIKYHLGRG
ncbi:glycosyltransferase family A protein [Desulfocurvibacter africanus]|uniref:glycosyltransferase family A protein n=1 Tax=Desulfocurvibacter africanus TaxID=873 RepID=UPI000488BE11|nr:glycosyltransferase family A protein [Desulfocurvibacter africanus]